MAENSKTQLDKENINQEELDRAQKFLIEHFGAQPDEKLGGLAVTYQRGWLLDGNGQGWKLSEILAAYVSAGAAAGGESRAQ